MSQKRKIMVIGSNSFSGSDFIDLLLGDGQNEVIGISRSPEKSALFLPFRWADVDELERALTDGKLPVHQEGVFDQAR